MMFCASPGENAVVEFADQRKETTAGPDGRWEICLDPLIGVDGRMPNDLFPWYFNVGRQRVRDGKVERIAISQTESHGFDNVSRFKRMWSK